MPIVSDSTNVPTPVSDVIAKMNEVLDALDTNESASDVQTLAEYVKGMLDATSAVETELAQKGISLVDVTNADPAHIADALPPTIVEAAYRKQELSYRTQDAHVHVIDMHETNACVPDPEAMQSSDFEEIARRFLDDYDCNLSENQQWENVILQYAKDFRFDCMSS